MLSNKSMSRLPDGSGWQEIEEEESLPDLPEEDINISCGLYT